VNPGVKPLSASQAASRLGVSVKALRLYEQRGLLSPNRTSAGWRSYGPMQMIRAGQIASLRGLGLSLAQVGRVLEGDSSALECALAAHEERLADQAQEIANTLSRVRRLRSGLVQGQSPTAELVVGLDVATRLAVSFDLPWPWNGEPFEMRDIPSLNFITGPLGSGKTRFAQRLTETLHDAKFIGLDRIADSGVDSQARLDEDPALNLRVERALAWLIEEGAKNSPGLIALLVELEAEGRAILVIDMIEEALDQATQEALISYIRSCVSKHRTLFLMTRSSSILDLDAMGSGEQVILCPANHSPPTCVLPYPGTPGYEAVATCLATPAVRARTHGVIAWRPPTALCDRA
jgi:DNA-binding transcriptional MerR regulator